MIFSVPVLLPWIRPCTITTAPAIPELFSRSADGRPATCSIQNRKRAPMMMLNQLWRGSGALGGVALCAVLGLAQSAPPLIQPLRTTPVESLTVNAGFGDWSPATVAGLQSLKPALT